MSSRESIVRVYLIYILILVFALFVVIKIASIQFFNGGELVEQAEKQTYKLKKVKAPRGNIFADNDQKTSLALSVPRYEIRMDLITVKESVFDEKIHDLADSLSVMFNHKSKKSWLDDLLLQREKRNRYYLINKSIRNDELTRLETFPILNLGQYSGGLIVLKENKRVKPYNKLAARTIGYVRETKGKYVGIEGAFNDELKGRDGEMLMQRIRGNEWKPIKSEFSKEPIPGCDVYSTIDVNIQDVAEAALMKQLKNQKALRGCVVLMEVETGFIKAIANLTQDSDKMEYNESLNHAVGLASEPGSTFKLASLMVALDDEKIKITDSVLMNGTYRFYKKYSLNDGNKVYGKNTIQAAFEKSSNIISKIIDDNYKENPHGNISSLDVYWLRS